LHNSPIPGILVAVERTKVTTEKPPLISLLVPIYNVEKFLVECLDSAANQTFADYEVICINDGSTDGSRDIIARYLEVNSRFRVIDKPNSGYGASMNRGLDEARGEYVAILESDDFIEPDTLERLYQTITEFDAEVVKANCWFYWAGPPETNTCYHLVPEDQCNRIVDPSVDHDIFLLKPSVWSALYRKDFLRANDIRFTETPGASYQDTAWTFKVWFNARRVVFLQEAFLHYRQDNQSSSVNSPGKVYCVVDEHTEMDRYLSSREIPAWLPAVKAKMKFDTYLWNYDRLVEELQREFITYMATELNADKANGLLDTALFKEWNLHDLDIILKSPKEFHRRRAYAGAEGRVGKALYYLKTGGPVLLTKVVLNKLRNRNRG